MSSTPGATGRAGVDRNRLDGATAPPYCSAIVPSIQIMGLVDVATPTLSMTAISPHSIS